MKFRETPRAPLEGELNLHAIVKDKRGREYLKRYPKDNPRIFRSLAHEYHALGFTNLGGTFRRRTPEEQRNFLEHAAQNGLSVLPPAYVDEKNINYYPFLAGSETLDEFLPHASDKEMEQVTYELFADLRQAHSNDIIYGDRWSKNILVVPSFSIEASHDSSLSDNHLTTVQRKLVHIDFDLEISGPVARELELAQVTYYTLCAGRQRVLPTLSKILAINVNVPNLNFPVFAQFLERHAIFFKDNKEYGNCEKEVLALIAAMYTLRGNR